MHTPGVLVQNVSRRVLNPFMAIYFFKQIGAVIGTSVFACPGVELDKYNGWTVGYFITGSIFCT